MKSFVIAFGLVVAGLCFSSTAGASTIIPSNCGTCGAHNTSFTVSYALIDDPQNIYQLTVTATYGAIVDFTYINDLAFKIDAFTNKYDSTPTVVGPDDVWIVMGGGLNSSGCDGSGAGFYCAQSAGFGAAAGAPGAMDTWVFTLNIDDALANLGLTAAGSLKAQFTDANGDKVGSLLSESVTYTPGNVTIAAVPEPASLTLLGSGLAFAVARFRRRRA